MQQTVKISRKNIPSLKNTLMLSSTFSVHVSFNQPSKISIQYMSLRLGEYMSGWFFSFLVRIPTYPLRSHVSELGGKSEVLAGVRSLGRNPGDFCDFAISGPQIDDFKRAWTLSLGFWFAKLSSTIEIRFYLQVTAFKDTLYWKNHLHAKNFRAGK